MQNIKLNKSYSFCNSSDKSLNNYYLMNKDKMICEFSIEILKEIPTEIFKQGHIIRPIINCNTVQDIEKFITKRQPPKHRKHIYDILKLCNISNIKGLIEYTHLVSLNDTYWVKSIDSNLLWEDVSLYTNKFDEIIAKTAFNGGMFGDTFSTVTPELGTDGTFAKCWIRGTYTDEMYLKKLGSSGFFNSGLEPFSEYYAQQVISALNLNNVEYTLHYSNRGYYTKCKLFTTEEVGLRPASNYCSNVTEVYRKYDELGLLSELKWMFIIDALIFNEDRHLGNFGFLVNNDTEEILGVAPLFDHNISMLCYAIENDFNTIDKYINTKGHKLLSGSFTEPVKSFLTSDIKIRLNNLYGFKLKPHPKYNLPQWRLDALNKLINNQIRLLCEK